MVQIKKKIVLLGDGAVGKTSLIRKFVTDKFSDDYIVTIGTKVTKKDLVLGDKELSLMIWDVLGQKGYTSTQEFSFKGSTGALIVADLTRKETLESLTKYWIPGLEKVAGSIPLIFLGNKADLKDMWQFDEEALAKVASSYGSPHMLTSAKTGLNVEEAFGTLGEALVSGRAAKAAAPQAEKAAATSTAVAGGKKIENLVDACDFIIEDFCKKFGDSDQAMPIVRQQFSKTGVDIRTPTLKGLDDVLDRLEGVERDLKGEDVAHRYKMRRRRALEPFRKNR